MFHLCFLSTTGKINLLSAVGTLVAGIGSFGAVATSLWLARKQDKLNLKVNVTLIK
jgi:hypothetical protein